MTTLNWRAVLTALVIAAFPTSSAIAQMGYSPPPARTDVPQQQQSQSRSQTPSSSHGPKLRSEIAKPLQEALKLQEAQDLAGAMVKIREADAIGGKTPEEEYVIAKFMGSVALKLNDTATATAAFNRALASNAIPAEEKPNVLYIAMVLNAQAKNFPQAVQIGEMLLALGPLDEKASVALSQSYYNKGDYPRALQIAQAALAKGATDATNKAALLEVQTKSQAQMGNQSGAVASLEQQCAEICDGKTWGQLVAITMSKLRGLTDHQALNLFRLRLVAGGMDADDYLTMATIDLSQALPAEAVSALEKGIAAGTLTRGGRAGALLSQASPKASADARSLPAFEREAAAKANGEVDIKLGETYYSHGQLAQAETALRRGLGKSGVRDRADAQIMLGIVLLAQGKKDEALKAFNDASSSAAQAPIAHLWTLYANRKG